MKGDPKCLEYQGNRRFLLNSASATVLFFVNVAVTFLVSPVIVRGLGNRDYGIWDLLLSFCGYLGLLEVGIGPALIRFVARSATLGDEIAVQRTFVTSFMALAAAGLTSLAVMLLLSLAPHAIFNVSPADSPRLAILCVLAGCNLLVQFTGTAAVAYLMGLQQHYRINVLRILLAIASGTAVWLALTRSAANGLLWLSSLLLAGNILQYGTFFLWARRAAGSGAWTLRLFSKRTLRELVQFGVNSFLLMLSDRIQRQSVPVVIGHTIGVANIVFYSIPARLAEYGMGLIAAMGFPLTPAFSAAEARGGIPETRRAWFESSRWMQLVMMGMAVGLGMLGHDFIAIWMGRQYADRGKWVVVMLAAAMFVSGLAPNSGGVLVALGRHGEVASRLVAISVAAVIASILAVPRLGLPGIALVVAAANICGFVLVWRKACSCLGMSVSEHLRMTLFRAGPAVAVFAAFLVGLRAAVRPPSYALIAGEVLVASVAYVAVAWRFALNAAERKAICDRLAAIAARLAGRPARAL